MQCVQGSKWRGRAIGVVVTVLLTGSGVAVADLDLWVEQERCVNHHWVYCDLEQGCESGGSSQCADGFEHFVVGAWQSGILSQDSEILQREIHATGHAKGHWEYTCCEDWSHTSSSRLRVVLELPVQAVVDLSAQIEADAAFGYYDWADYTYSYAVTLILRDFCPDIDGDGAIAFAEVLAVLRAWGETCEPECVEDVDSDGVVDLADLLFILESWGPCATESNSARSGSSEGPAYVRLTTLEGTPLFDLSIPCVGDYYAEHDDSILLGPGHYVLEADALAALTYRISGACCFADGTCTDSMIECDCVIAGGSFGGDGSSCTVACPVGACCFNDGACQEATVESECASEGGLYAGVGSTCAGQGACCFDSGSCLDLNACECVAFGGLYRGDGTTCAADCRTGACCLIESCVVTVSEFCAAMGGTYRGDDTTCATSCNLSRDDCSDAIVFGGGAYFYSSVGATTDGPDLPPECDEGLGLGFEKDVWFRYAASCDGTATASACESSFNNRMAIYDDGDCPGPFIACNDDACGIAGTRSEVSFAVEAGGVYLIRIGSRTGSIGTGTLVISCEP